MLSPLRLSAIHSGYESCVLSNTSSHWSLTILID